MITVKKLIIVLLAAVTLGLSNYLLIPFLMPICFALLFYVLEKETNTWKSIGLASLFSLLAFVRIAPSMAQGIEKHFTITPVEGVLSYLLFSLFQSLGLTIGLSLGVLTNKLITNKTIRTFNLAFTTFFATSLFPYLIEWKFSYALMKVAPSLSQWADTIGFFGLDLLIYLIAASIAIIYINPKLRLENSLILIMILSLISITSLYKKGFYNKFDTQVNLLLVQSNRPVSSKISGSDDKIYSELSLNKNYDLTNSVSKDGINLIIWPELQIPHIYNNPETSIQTNVFSAFIYKNQIPLIAGARTLVSPSGKNYWNSVLFFSKDGVIQNFYHSRHLMPFVKVRNNFNIDLNIPLRVQELEKEYKDKDSNLIPLTKDKVEIKIQTFTGYEFLSSKNDTKKDSDLIIVLSNDDLFDQSEDALTLIDMMIRSKSIEFRKAIVRSSPSGLSSAIDRRGFSSNISPVFSESALKTSLKIKKDSNSIYYKTRHIQPFAIIVIWVIGALIFLRRKKQI